MPLFTILRIMVLVRGVFQLGLVFGLGNILYKFTKQYHLSILGYDFTFSYFLVILLFGLILGLIYLIPKVTLKLINAHISNGKVKDSKIKALLVYRSYPLRILGNIFLISFISTFLLFIYTKINLKPNLDGTIINNKLILLKQKIFDSDVLKWLEELREKNIIKSLTVEDWELLKTKILDQKIANYNEFIMYMQNVLTNIKHIINLQNDTVTNLLSKRGWDDKYIFDYLFTLKGLAIVAGVGALAFSLYYGPSIWGWFKATDGFGDAVSKCFQQLGFLWRNQIDINKLNNMVFPHYNKALGYVESLLHGAKLQNTAITQILNELIAVQNELVRLRSIMPHLASTVDQHSADLQVLAQTLQELIK